MAHAGGAGRSRCDARAPRIDPVMRFLREQMDLADGWFEIARIAIDRSPFRRAAGCVRLAA